MSRQNVLASVVYQTAIRLKDQNFNQFRQTKKREQLIAELCAMQFLTHCIGSECLSDSQTRTVIFELQNQYGYETKELSERLKVSFDTSDSSPEYHEVVFQMQKLLSSCIFELTQKKKGYLDRTSMYIKAFHNLPRAFLSITDKEKILPQEALKYALAYLK